MSIHKLLLATLSLLLGLLVACGPTAAEPGAPDPTTAPDTALPTAEPAPDETPQADASDNPIVVAARAFLAAQLGIGEDDIEVVSAEETEFTDSCLGLGQANESCLQAMTPGWLLVLSAGGEEYEVHSDATGTQVRVAAGMAGGENSAITASAAAVLADALQIDPATITVVSAEKTEFSDSCLGLGGAAESCAQVITPGWLVVLSAGGQEYTVHTDATGVSVRIADN